jgi:hypothetical protein
VRAEGSRRTPSESTSAGVRVGIPVVGTCAEHAVQPQGFLRIDNGSGRRDAPGSNTGRGKGETCRRMP